MSNFRLLFSDYFEIESSNLEEAGFLNICLTSDLPLFIDPFLLFASDKTDYKKLHKEVVSHLLTLKNFATINDGKDVNVNLFRFPEIKQNWLGLSVYGNGGKGLGKKFASGMISSFNGFYNNFGEEEITDESHIEKLSLLNPGVGKDFISDFTTNLILEYLLKKTQEFAIKNLKENQIKEFNIRCKFDVKTKTWQPKIFKLPYFYRETNGDFIILTPLDILTIDDAAINTSDFYSTFFKVTRSLDNSSLRAAVNDYFKSHLPRKPTKEDRFEAFQKTIKEFPDLVDFYIKSKEESKTEVTHASLAKIEELIDKLINVFTPLCDLLLNNSDFYSIQSNTYEEALQRVMFLKDVIENNDGYRIFYDGLRPTAKEDTVQRIFRLTWYASPYDVNAEVNNGRGPVDYKVSFGSGDSTIVEFKLGKSSSLERNLQNQTNIYKTASKSPKDITVILCYTAEEIKKTNKILKKIEKENHENIVIIEATRKISASKV